MKRLFFLCLILVCFLSGCDRIRGILGMATSGDIEKARKELIEKAAAQRLRDSLEALKIADSVARHTQVRPADEGLEKRYYIIVGSFKREKNSAGMLAFLKKQGYEPVKIPLKNGYDMVALCGYDTYYAARTEVDKIEQQEVCPYDVWIYDTEQKLHK